VVPIPPSGAVAGAPPDPLVPAPNDWKPVEESRPDALPLCGPSQRGDRRFRSGPKIHLKVDGTDFGVATARYEFRAAGKGACLAGLSVWVPDIRPSPKPPRLRTAPKGRVSYSIIRVDLAGKRADGIELADSPSSADLLTAVRRMRCALTSGDGETPR
jgi:hypothetical protein